MDMVADRRKGIGLSGVAIVTLLILVAGCGAGDATPDGAAVGATPNTGAAEPLATVAPEQAATMTIAEVLRTDERFSRFRQIAERVETPIAESGLAVWDWKASRMGDNQDDVTVFVPTDAAFEALDPAVLAVLDGLMGHHYIHRLYPSAELQAGPQRTWRRSVSGPVELTLDPLTWGGHLIEQTDLRAANGYIHVVGGVVVPDEVAAAADG